MIRCRINGTRIYLFPENIARRHIAHDFVYPMLVLFFFDIILPKENICLIYQFLPTKGTCFIQFIRPPPKLSLLRHPLAKKIHKCAVRIQRHSMQKSYSQKKNYASDSKQDFTPHLLYRNTFPKYTEQKAGICKGLPIFPKLFSRPEKENGVHSQRNQ